MLESVNPAISKSIYNSTLRQYKRLRKHQKDIAKGKSVAFIGIMVGREVKQQFNLQNLLKKLELAHSCILNSNWICLCSTSYHEHL